jgi:vacuolar-type H+-ATPase subunit I/STV1
LQTALANEEKLRGELQKMEAEMGRKVEELKEMERQLEEERERARRKKQMGAGTNLAQKEMADLTDVHRKLQTAVQKAGQLQERMERMKEEKETTARRAELAEKVGGGEE